MFSRLRSFAAAVLQRRRFEADMSAEMRFHVDEYEDDLVASGLSRQEAARRARVEFGGVEGLKEEGRQARGLRPFDELQQDLRYGFRLLRRDPLVTLAIVASLALGVGATTAIFTVANGLLLRSAAGVSDPARLVDIVRTKRGRQAGVIPSSYSDYVAVRDRVRAVQGVYAYRLELVPVGLKVESSGSERAFACVVTPRYFQALGVVAAAGRLFSADERDQSDDSFAIVLSHEFWTRRFYADDAVVGQSVGINGQLFTIVGVAAAGFRGTSVVAPDLWVRPSTGSAAGSSDSPVFFNDLRGAGLMLGGRLQPGVSRAQAAAELQAIGRWIEREAPERGGSVTVPDGHDLPGDIMQWRVEPSSPIPFGLRLIVAGFLTLLMGVVSIVLLIACANVAGVLLARAAARNREMAVRIAIGAARRRIVRQLLTETALLFLWGGIAGLLVARVLTSVLVALLPAFPVPVNLSMPLDGRVVAFSLALSLVAALVSGMAPARYASKTDVMSALKDNARLPDKMRLRDLFVVGQVAFSLVLVVMAGVLGLAVARVGTIDHGFDVEGVVAAEFDLSMSSGGSAAGARFAAAAIERIRTLPGVETASAADRLPDVRRRVHQLRVRNMPGSSVSPSLAPNWHMVEPGYFRTLQMPILQGRDFTTADRAGGQPVIIVSDSAARSMWPDEPAVGKQLTWDVHAGDPAVAGPPAPAALLVVGVVGDLNYGSSGQAAPMDFYVPLQQRPTAAVTLLVRSANETQAIADLRALITTIEPKPPTLGIQSLQRHQAGPVETQLRVAAAVAGAVGVVGLLLAAIGIYGVTAYLVTQRTREIGVRLAMGAEAGVIVGMILRQGMARVATGLCLGLVLSAGAIRVLAASPLGALSLSPGVLIGASALFGLIGVAASYAPARRAGRIDPVNLLRAE
jgi:predicted permease